MEISKYLVKFTGGNRKKSLFLILVLLLLMGGIIGGTVAWLIDTPEPIINTFTYGDINIELTETETNLDNDGNATTNAYKMMPGQSITKDPTITVISGSEDMWLFVELDKSANFGDFLTYTVADGWTALSSVEGVYYQQIDHDDVASADLEIAVIKDNTVTVKDSVTKAQLNALDANGASNYPTLTVTAYAVQKAGSNTAADAWAKVTVNP